MVVDRLGQGSSHVDFDEFDPAQPNMKAEEKERRRKRVTAPAGLARIEPSKGGVARLREVPGRRREMEPEGKEGEQEERTKNQRWRKPVGTGDER